MPTNSQENILASRAYCEHATTTPGVRVHTEFSLKEYLRFGLIFLLSLALINRLPSNLLCGYLIGIGIAFLMPVLLSPSFLEHYRSDSDNVTVKFSYNFFLQLNRSFRNLVYYYTTTMENVFRSQIGMPARNVFYNHITRSQS
ncbi:hypothetical protein GQX74_005869 [Glossina fuscipes]|nr:hypothetical protein GQX74_005869 [Glossina fuscipes]